MVCPIACAWVIITHCVGLHPASLAHEIFYCLRKYLVTGMYLHSMLHLCCHFCKWTWYVSFLLIGACLHMPTHSSTSKDLVSERLLFSVTRYLLLANVGITTLNSLLTRYMSHQISFALVCYFTKYILRTLSTFTDLVSTWFFKHTQILRYFV